MGGEGGGVTRQDMSDGQNGHPGDVQCDPFFHQRPISHSPAMVGANGSGRNLAKASTAVSAWVDSVFITRPTTAYWSMNASTQAAS